MTSALIILEAAETQDLTTLDTVKQELNVTTNDQDDIIRAQIHQASSQIAAYCNRVFGLETVEEHFIAVDSVHAITLRRRPVDTLISIKTSTGDNIPLTDYILDDERGILYRKYPYFAFYHHYYCGDIVVTYSAGYDLLDHLPYALERGCIVLVKEYFNKIGGIPNLRTEDIPGVAAYSYETAVQAALGTTTLSPEALSYIEPFKEAVVA